MWQGANSGMGGPLEPVGDANAKTPDSDDVNDSGAPVDKSASAGTTMSGTGSGQMNHDMSNMGGSDAAGQKPATSAATNPGIGGPIEARSNYPVCSRTVTDSCIQLSGRSRSK